MADEIVYKKMTRKADKGLEGKVVAKHGKQTNQKLKPYVVLEYLLKYSDENNTKSAYDIIGYLEGCGISAERRSIYRDIEDINRIMLMLQLNPSPFVHSQTEESFPQFSNFFEPFVIAFLPCFRPTAFLKN